VLASEREVDKTNEMVYACYRQELDMKNMNWLTALAAERRWTKKRMIWCTVIVAERRWMKEG
jgi:hypothetical protein